MTILIPCGGAYSEAVRPAGDEEGGGMRVDIEEGLRKLAREGGRGRGMGGWGVKSASRNNLTCPYCPHFVVLIHLSQP